VAFNSSLDTAPSLRGVEGRAPAVPGARGRGLRALLPVVPFLAYVGVGLGIPTYIIATLAFSTRAGRFTLHNIRVITSGGQYLLGFETSLKLALVTALIPGVLGTVLAYAIAQSNHETFKRVLAAASGVLANFGGVNLAFMFVASLGPAGVATAWLSHLHLNPYDHGWTLYKFTGVALVYMYFQVPLMVLVITPALNGLREQWREAASNLGASRWQYWRYVGLPVLTPPVLGSMFLLFGSGFSAYATTEALTGGTIALTPIQIGSILQGNVISGQENVGYALGLGMIVILLVSVIAYALLQRRTSRWLRP
jgi:putative spermidine/putrescine transport system permease protein